MDLVELAAELRDKGMSLAHVAEEFVSPLFHERAYAALVALARMSPTVHIDDYLSVFTEKPSHPNCFGQVWHRAIREHVIIHSGRVKPCTVDPTKHKHQSPVYMSLLYRRTK